MNPNNAASLSNVVSGMETYRLTQLGLPKQVVDIAKSLTPPSQGDLQQVATLFRQSEAKSEVIRRLLQTEANVQSPMLDGLTQAQTIARLRMQVCRSIQAAWRRLPLEIWDRIFAYHLDATRSGATLRDFDGTNKAATLAPSTLSLVSKLWRAVVLATPSIWKDVTIFADEALSSDSSPLVPVEDVERILGRLNRVSATPYRSSLTISLPGSLNPRRTVDDDQSDDSQSTGTGESSSVATDGIPIHILLQCHQVAHAVERVCVVAPPDYDSDFDTQLGSLKFSSAKSVAVAGYGLLYCPDATLRFPAIKSAVLINTFKYQSIPPCFPWAQLTNLLLGEGIASKTMYLVLSMCTSLVKGSFWLQEGGDEDVPVATPTTMHFLVDLSLIRCRKSRSDDWDYEERESDTDNPIIPCPDFSFPSLRQLCVFSDNVSFATFNNLTRLVVLEVDVPHNLDAILGGCPMLSALSASCSCHSSSLKPLVYDPNRPKGLFLQSLALVCTSSSAYGISGASQFFIDIVRSRRSSLLQLGTSSPVPLKRFVVRLNGSSPTWLWSPGRPDPIIQNLRASMQPFVADGLEFSYEELSKGSREYWPRLERDSVKHWEDGMLDILDDTWR